MAKDSYWFKHDSTSGRGKRIRKIQFIYTHWGKGVYWDVIEYLREQDEYKSTKDEFTLKMICDIIGCKDEAKFLSWFNDCIKEQLFITDEKYFYSEVLITNMKRWEESKEYGKTGGNPNFKKGEPNPYYKAKDKGKDNPNNKGKDKHNSIVYNIIEDKKEALKNALTPFVEKYGRETLNKFYQHWGEPNKSQTKLRWELQKTWDLNLRLIKWVSNEKVFNPKKDIPQPLQGTIQ